MVKSPKLLNSMSFFIAAQLYACLGYSSAHSFPSIWSGILLTCCPGALVFLQLCCFPCLCVNRTEISVCKFSCCSPSSFMFFAVVDAHGHTLVCAVLWKTCSLTFLVLPHADLLPTGILPSQWLDITRSLAELGEMENHPAAASITQGMTGTKSASWSRRSSLTSRWELQSSTHLPAYTALALVWFAYSNLWIWKDEMKFSESKAEVGAETEKCL